MFPLFPRYDEKSQVGHSHYLLRLSSNFHQCNGKSTKQKMFDSQNCV